MNFIGNNHNTVFKANGRKFFQLTSGPNHPSRVLRITKQQQFRVFVDFRLQIIEIEGISAIFNFKRIFNQFSFGPFTQSKNGK
jgi:hypothetical protein